MPVVFVQLCDPEILHVVQMILNLDGLDVHTFTAPGPALIRAAAMRKPDLLILDHQLDGAACLETFLEISSQMPGLPVVVAGCSSLVSAFCQQHGFCDFIEMPFDLLVFYETVMRCLPEGIRPAHPLLR
ncbi:hypothetical protein GCM10023149_29220 [Mucilaginibacter gynuensis]|uniref:Response regulatory domain-containing protein n=1 Tax=Mucilaginibacter gynuensis TaxID=1302236 RepID=A0ABP8GLV0_9SPHI